MVVQLTIFTPFGEEKVIDLCENEEQMMRITVQHLKKKITEELRLGDVDVRTIFRTEPLEDSKLLESYGIRHLSTIHSVLKVSGGGDADK